MFFAIFDPKTPIYVIIASFVGLIIAISFHEFCHAFVADRLGDHTPRSFGRLTLNPKAHIDPIGFLAILFLPIGWGKPVPVNPLNFKNPRIGDVLTTAAGPISNFILVTLSVILLKIYIFAFFAKNILLIQDDPIFAVGMTFININILLFLFNLLPIPPLDGYHVWGYFLPRHIRDSVDDFFARQNFFLTILFLFIISQFLMPFLLIAFDYIQNFIVTIL